MTIRKNILSQLAGSSIDFGLVGQIIPWSCSY